MISFIDCCGDDDKDLKINILLENDKMGKECKYINSSECTTLETMSHVEKIAEDGLPFVQIAKDIRMSADYAMRIGEIAVENCLCRTPEHVKCPAYSKLEEKPKT